MELNVSGTYSKRYITNMSKLDGVRRNNRTPDLRNRVFGMWTVIRFIGYSDPSGVNRSRVSVWVCQCKCGHKQKLSFKNLKSIIWTECGGCRIQTRGEKVNKPGQAGLNHLYGSYLCQSRRRGFAFDLTKDEFAKITSSNCFYCGVNPSQVYFTRCANVTKKRVDYGSYMYNGLDRKNNSLHYTKKNTVPCCSTCNYLKRALSVDEFIRQIKKILNHYGAK